MKKYCNKGTGMWAMILGGLNLVFIGVAISGSVALEGVTEARVSVNQAKQPLQTSDAGSGVMPGGLQQAVLSRQQRIEADPDTAQAYRARNPEQGLSIRFSDSGVEVSPQKDQDAWRWSMELTAYGYGKDLQPVENAVLKIEGNRITYERGNISEWYINGRRGLEQGFTLAAPPGTKEDSGDLLVMALSLSGDLMPKWRTEGEAVAFTDASGRTVLRYEELYAFDATGRDLPVRLALAAGEFSILVDDTNATYPLSIDPLIFTEDAKLLASDGGPGDLFGWSVVINGDTAVIGAPYDDDVCPGTINCNSGAAYVFVRSGTTWSEEAKLFASDGAAGDVFGESVAISGETAVIGAWLDDDKGMWSGLGPMCMCVAERCGVRRASFWPQMGQRGTLSVVPFRLAGIRL